jgi:hypothetical protein
MAVGLTPAVTLVPDGRFRPSDRITMEKRKSPGRSLGVIGGERERRSSAPGSLIASIWYRTNRHWYYTALVTLCKGFGTKIGEISPYAPRKGRRILQYPVYASVYDGRCCDSTKFSFFFLIFNFSSFSSPVPRSHEAVRGRHAGVRVSVPFCPDAGRGGG